MKCPVCLTIDTMVTDSRISSDGLAVRRRRQCQKCNFRFSTYEEMEILNLTVIKRDGRREPYLKEKLSEGLKKALEKRPYTADDFKKLITYIEREIQKKKREEITSQEIGEMVMKILKRFDKVAYIRFASVYRSFEDVQTFQRELNILLKKPSQVKSKKTGKKVSRQTQNKVKK